MGRKTQALGFVVALFATIVTPCFGQNEKCKVSINVPKDDTIIVDNGRLSHLNLFAFSVSGFSEHIGKMKICLYQKLPGGNQWWRSGEPIQLADLGPNGKWMTVFASCGSRSNPHPQCVLKAVIQRTCPKSGSQVSDIPAYVCDSPAITVRTR